jgi:hypothetical protein
MQVSASDEELPTLIELHTFIHTAFELHTFLHTAAHPELAEPVPNGLTARWLL